MNKLHDLNDSRFRFSSVKRGDFLVNLETKRVFQILEIKNRRMLPTCVTAIEGGAAEFCATIDYLCNGRLFKNINISQRLLGVVYGPGPDSVIIWPEDICESELFK